MTNKFWRAVIAALVVSFGGTHSNEAQPPRGGCNPVGYTMFCQHTCTYEERVGGGCQREGNEPTGSYCLEVSGVPGACHDGGYDQCCALEPVV